jgi:hypothetical protein
VETGAPPLQDGKKVAAITAAQEVGRVYPIAVEAGEPLLKTCGEGKPRMAVMRQDGGPRSRLGGRQGLPNSGRSQGSHHDDVWERGKPYGPRCGI